MHENSNLWWSTNNVTSQSAVFFCLLLLLLWLKILSEAQCCQTPSVYVLP